MPRPTPPALVKAIRADYLDCLADGSYRFTLKEIAERHNVRLNLVCSLMTRRGLSRYARAAVA
jgi:hypothetical protein